MRAAAVKKCRVSAKKKGSPKSRKLCLAIGIGGFYAVQVAYFPNFGFALGSAEVPDFISEKPLDIETEQEVKAVGGKAVVKFTLPKIGAMQSASVSYKVPRMVSQAEANSVPLPAVISYRQGKPLVIAQVKVEKPVKRKAAAKKAAKPELEKAKAVVKKGAKKGQLPAKKPAANLPQNRPAVDESPGEKQ